MRFKKRGEITIFLALIMAVLLAFFVTLITGIRRYTAKARIVLAMDCALESCFAEYNKYLFEKYHVMYIDPSYKKDIYEEDLLKEHLSTYLQENLREDEGSITGLTLRELEITEKRCAGDDGYGDFYNQIRDYCINNPSINLSERAGMSRVLYRYIVDCFCCATDKSGQRLRTGEIEYIIYRNDEDFENINQARADYEEYVDRVIEYGIYDEMLSYEEYVLDKLEDISNDELLSGIEGLINEDVRAHDSVQMELKNCVHYILVKASIDSIYDFKYSITREYMY